MKKNIRHFGMLSLTTLLGVSLTGTAFAKTINLYQEPQTTSKIVGTVDTASGVVSIYSPKKSDWVKVGDPKNGMVGWVKKTDLGDAKINFNIMTSGGHGEGYQVFQFGNTTPYSSEEAAKVMQQIQERQKIIQQEVQKSLQQLYQNTLQMWNTMPMMVPSSAVPEKKAQENKMPATKPAT